jgi:hypothetical protein
MGKKTGLFGGSVRSHPRPDRFAPLQSLVPHGLFALRALQFRIVAARAVARVLRVVFLINAIAFSCPPYRPAGLCPALLFYGIPPCRVAAPGAPGRRHRLCPP